MKKKAEIEKLKRFLEKDTLTLPYGAFTVWETLKWVLDEEGEEGFVGGGVIIRENKVSLDFRG